jgi:hypothetical protein
MRLIPMLLLLAACGPSARARCDARAGTFDTQLASYPPRTTTAPSGIDLPTTSRGEVRVLSAPQVVLRADGTYALDGRPMTIESMQQDLETIRRNWSILHLRTPYSPELIVWADASAPTSVLEQLRTALPEQEFLVGAWDASVAAIEPAACPPSLGAHCAAIAGASGSARATAVAAAMHDAVGSCTALTTMLARLANADAESRAETLLREVAPALRECQCEADVEGIEYLVIDVVGMTDRRTRVVAVTGAINASATPTIGSWLAPE